MPRSRRTSEVGASQSLQRLCFLSLNCRPILTSEDEGFAGGAEVEQSHLGLELAARGMDISFVTYGRASDGIARVGDVKVIGTYDRADVSSLNRVRKLSRLWKALERADAEAYFYESGAAGVLSLFCRITRLPFLFRIPSDAVVVGTPLEKRRRLGRSVADMADLVSADALIVQTQFQKDLLKERFGFESILIRNGLPIPTEGLAKGDRPLVVWVGSLSELKNPRAFVRLAEALPDIRFELVGGKTRDLAAYGAVEEALARLPNFTYRGFVPFHKINRVFESAHVLVNTSRIEGFPNTFLQAWSMRVPVVSLVADPDGVIGKFGLGFHSGSFEQMVADVSELARNASLRDEMGQRARKYVESHHNILEIANQYIEVFKRLI